LTASMDLEAYLRICLVYAKTINIEEQLGICAAYSESATLSRIRLRFQYEGGDSSLEDYSS
jgi:hypothetical protein